MKYSFEKTYLDERPFLHKTLKDFCAGLDLDAWGSGSDNWLHYCDARRRDGCIPALHNHGAFDVYNTLECEYDDADDEGTIKFHGFRIMYEGVGLRQIHTVCVYYCQWYETDVWGIERAPVISEVEIRFRSPEALIRKLKSFTKKAV